MCNVHFLIRRYFNYILILAFVSCEIMCIPNQRDLPASGLVIANWLETEDPEIPCWGPRPRRNGPFNGSKRKYEISCLELFRFVVNIIFKNVLLLGLQFKLKTCLSLKPL